MFGLGLTEILLLIVVVVLQSGGLVGILFVILFVVVPKKPPTSWPPGWYADPVEGVRQRYWDGTTWTEEVRRPT